MGAVSKIQWTDSSWNPIRARNKATGAVGWHCEHVTPGCEHCYAEAMNKRLGTELPFKPGHMKDIELFLDEEMLTAPLRWRKPRKVFVCSMTDLFADFVPDEWIGRIWQIMHSAHSNRGHTFQVLTKRPENMRRALGPQGIGWYAVVYGSVPWPEPGIWLGVSVEDRQRKTRIDSLRDTPAVVRFLSVEPLIEDVGALDLRGISWVIVGGESGPGARPFDIAWARSVIAQCKAAGVLCFVKQLGANVRCADTAGFPDGTTCSEPDGYGYGWRIHLRDRKGGDPSEWPHDTRVREYPAINGATDD